MNNGIRVKKIAIAKKYTAFPKQRTFARLHLLLKMGHRIMNSTNIFVNDIRAIAIGDTFHVLAHLANITENRYRCFVCPLSLVFSCIRGSDVVHWTCL